MNYTIPEDVIKSVLVTLKAIDVRGFDSMNRLVGLVMLFEQIMQTPVTQPVEEIAEEKTEGEG